MIHPAAFAVLLFICEPAWARLHETVSECDRRYGVPVSFVIEGSEHSRVYEKAGYHIVVVFSADKAVEIYYSRQDRRLLSRQELLLFLQVNAAEARWARVDQVAAWKKQNRGRQRRESAQNELLEDLAAFHLWMRTDDKAEAAYDRQAGVLFVADSGRLEAERETTAFDPGNPHGF